MVYFKMLIWSTFLHIEEQNYKLKISCRKPGTYRKISYSLNFAVNTINKPLVLDVKCKRHF